MNGEGAGLPPDHPVSFGNLIEAVVQQSYQQLVYLSQSLRGQDDISRKVRLRHYLLQCRVRFAKLVVLYQWTKNNPTQTKSGKEMGVSTGQTISSTVQKLTGMMNYHEFCYEQSANQIYNVYNGLKFAEEPSYDLVTAIDVLSSGTYRRLPAAMEHPILDKPPEADEETQKIVLQRLDQLIDAKISSIEIPSVYTSVSIDNGMAICQVEHEFSAHLTLVENVWVVVKLDVHVSSDREASDGAAQFNYSNYQVQIDAVCRCAQFRLIDAENILSELYEVIHSFCVSLQLYILYSQSMHLRKTKPNLALQPDLDGVKRILTARYWGDRVTNKMEAPVLEISVEDDDLEISHNPPIVDPVTGQTRTWPTVRGTNFSDWTLWEYRTDLMKQLPDRLNFAAILERVILSSAKSQLGLLHEALQQSSDDQVNFGNRVSLSQSDDLDDLYLRVDLIGPSSLYIVVDNRTGKYIMRIEPTTETHDSLQKQQDDLNAGGVDKVSKIVRGIFRQKILEFYAQAAYSAKLIPTKHVPTKGTSSTTDGREMVQETDGITFSSDALYMRFPPPYQEYYLVVDVSPLLTHQLYLLKTRPNPNFPAYVDVEKAQVIERTVPEDILNPKPLPISACYQLLDKPNKFT